MVHNDHIRIRDTFDYQFQSYKINEIYSGKAMGFCVICGITVGSPVLLINSFSTGNVLGTEL